MTISVRPAHDESDYRQLLNLLETNLPHRPHARLFQWLYCRNPAGPARAWVAADSTDGRIIGVAAAFPRRIHSARQEARGYVLGDFCIHPGYRSLGAALALQQACLQNLSDDADFVFDFPSRTMLAVYQRLRIEANAAIVRHAKLLRVNRRVAERVPVRALARGLSAVANAGLRLRDFHALGAGDLTLDAEAGPWGEEFTQAAWEWSPSMGICVARTAEYLNWRYGEHPVQHYEMLTARRRGRLCGYLIQHFEGEDGTVDDLLAENEFECNPLLEAAVVIARQRRVHTLSVPWLAGHSGSRLLETCGFRARESSSVIALALPRAARRYVGPTNGRWHLTHGDRES
jgi:GNAT superfamily N-acetyltransferase